VLAIAKGANVHTANDLTPESLSGFQSTFLVVALISFQTTNTRTNVLSDVSESPYVCIEPSNAGSSLVSCVGAVQPFGRI
jgi:hypothetical protein